MTSKSSMVFTEREISNEAIKILGAMNLEKDDYEKVKYLIRESSSYLHRIARERQLEDTYISECNFVIREGERHLVIAADCLKLAALNFIRKKNEKLTKLLEKNDEK